MHGDWLEFCTGPSCCYLLCPWVKEKRASCQQIDFADTLSVTNGYLSIIIVVIVLLLLNYSLHAGSGRIISVKSIQYNKMELKFILTWCCPLAKPCISSYRWFHESPLLLLLDCQTSGLLSSLKERIYIIKQWFPIVQYSFKYQCLLSTSFSAAISLRFQWSFLGTEGGGQFLN